MYKDFRRWHWVKQAIQAKEHSPYFYEREVRWCSVGLNVGTEVDGKGRTFSRPVLILKAFNKDAFLGIPLTTKIKSGKYYYLLDLGDGPPRCVVISQVRFLDAKRLGERMAVISKEEFAKIKRAVSAMIA